MYVNVATGLTSQEAVARLDRIIALLGKALEVPASEIPAGTWGDIMEARAIATGLRASRAKEASPALAGSHSAY